MSNSSILGGTPAPYQAEGKDVDMLGPSDSSDSGSDVQGEATTAIPPDLFTEGGLAGPERYADSDASGTGERASAGSGSPRDGADILPDRIVSSPDEDADAELPGGIAPVDLDGLASDEDGEGDEDGEEDDDERKDRD